MYQNFYRMKREAFINQPLPEVYFNSSTHHDAWNFLLHNIKVREQFLLICGDYGAGKTTLCMRLAQALKKLRKVPFVLVPTPTQPYPALLCKIAESLGIPASQENGSVTQDALLKYFEEREQKDGLILIVDDAQDMDISTLNQLRLLANFNIEGFFPVRLFLFSHFSFMEKLKIDILQPLNQRIKRRLYLRPFNLTETKEYIYFRLVKAGAPGIPSFEDDAIKAIYDYSKGTPRSINNICDCCLLVGSGRGLTIINDSVVSKAICYIEGEDRDPASSPEKAPGDALGDKGRDPVVRSGPEQVAVEYPLVDTLEHPPGEEESVEVSRRLKNIIIVALVMLTLGIVLAISFDLGAVLKSFLKLSHA